MKLNRIKASQNLPATSLKCLVAAIAVLAVTPISQADVAKRQIGDLEIYKAAEGGKVTITMMLDTSGSMGLTQSNVGYGACDLPSGVRYSSYTYEDSATTPSYKRYFCKVSNNIPNYYYYKDSTGKWFQCGSSGDGSTSKTDCAIPLAAAPSTTGLTNSSNYYYKNKQFYDRITRLKDAIFALMDSKSLDSNKIAIGIGQFSTQSDSSNAAFTADGVSGKILVPAALIDDTQRAAIKNAIAGLTAYNGTPSANAYAEAGAYMLGETTASTMQFYFVRDRDKYYKTCSRWTANTCSTWSSWSSSRFNIDNTMALGRGTVSNESGTYYSKIGQSGFVDSFTDSKNTSTAKYKSPINSTNAQCDGHGIYFLTDGLPNNSTDPTSLMQLALGDKGNNFSVSSTNNLQNYVTGDGWNSIGAFAKALRTTTSNPQGLNIKTAVVGFGSDYDVSSYSNILQTLKAPLLDQTTALPVKDAQNNWLYQDKTATYFDCSLMTTNSNDEKAAKNTCNWGAKSHPSLPGVGGYGEGGFYSAQSTDDVVYSIVNFVSDLTQDIPAAPSGVITIPDDPYNAASQLAVAYYPMVEAKVADNSLIWPGNVKKYNLNQGTLYGKNNAKLFKNTAGELQPTTDDLWSSENNTTDAYSVKKGGFYSQLATPKTGVNKVRRVYVEDWDNATTKKPTLKLFGVNDAGRVTVDGNLLSTTPLVNTALYTEDTLKTLLKFLGFNNIPTSGAVKDMILSAPTERVKVLGASIHSTPAAVSYSATMDSSGRVTTTRDDYVLFGSMDGALHMVNADNYGTSNGGQERFAFIPATMLTAKNAPALVSGSTGSDIGKPNFGIDAPWLVTADYSYDFNSSLVKVDTSGSGNSKKGVFAYGGLRMGGDTFYGMDLSSANTGNPSLMFAITPTSTGFTRLGQIWAKPTKAKIRTTQNATDKGTDVLVFGGGYDTCYEDDNYQVGTTSSTLSNQRGLACNRTTNTNAVGNAVYIINAKTGALIWSASGDTGATTVNSDMKNSVVGEVTVLDRNNDGFMDHIYFADLGGQVFRADFRNAGDNTYAIGTNTTTSTPATSFNNTRVTKILSSKYSGTDTKYALRFYERPVVSFYRHDTSNNLFAVVNVISGDRSSPLSTLRSNISYADRIYGIWDTDVTRPDTVLYATDFATTTDASRKQKIVALDDSKLLTLPFSSTSGATKTTARQTLLAGTNLGWYYPLSRFDGFANVLYNKGMGKSDVYDSMLYTTVYNPDMAYGTTDPCSAKIVGGSERQLYCLPYGICMQSASANGTGGYISAGQGIQELVIGPRSSSQANERILIGTNTLTERADASKRVNFGTDSGKDASLLDDVQISKGNTPAQPGGDGSAGEYKFFERYTLVPRTWYEQY